MYEHGAIVDTETRQRLQAIMHGMTGTIDELLNAALDELEAEIQPLQSRCKCGAGVAPAEASSATVAEVSTVAEDATPAPPERYRPAGKRTLSQRDIKRTIQAYVMRQDQAKSWREIGAYLGLRTASAKFRVKNWAKRVGRAWPVQIK